jgi:hypothetical protein
MAELSEKDIRNILKNNDSDIGNTDGVDMTLDDIESFGNRDSLKEMYTNIANYNRMIKERITLINESLTTAIPFTRENLYLFCAYSGNGKSTIAANISFPLWKQGKKTLIISNEESKEDVLFRIACLDMGLNFNDYKKGRMPIDVQKAVVKRFDEIGKFVKVLDVNYAGGEDNNGKPKHPGFTTKVECVKKALDTIKGQDYSCAMIDYFQLIKFSATGKPVKQYDILNDFRIWLGQYIKQSNVPIVLFAQLHSLGKRNNKDLDSRIKHCPDVYEPSTVVIEAVPNFDDQTTDFIIHKDRFGLAGQKVVCSFEGGRYVNMTEDALRQKSLSKLEELQNTIEGDDNNE